MKYNMMAGLYGTVLDGIIKKDIPDKNIRRAIKKEYRAVIERAADIGSNNKLIGSYLLAAYFIGMVRSTGKTADENIAIMDKNMRTSKALKAFMGDSKHYFSEKNMESRRKWSAQTYERKYKNDWVVDVLEETPEYTFGFNYQECGVCKLCRDEGCPELAKYLCSLDFMLVEIMGIGLTRTMTLANGDPYCDFRFHKLS